LFLTNENDLDTFTNNYAITKFPYRFGDCINWVKVAKSFSGIVISPYILGRRFNLFWYYNWDCASGCVWNLNVIKLAKGIKENQKSN
jgi:hypothetical protein